MQTASVPTGYTAIGSSDGDQEFVGSSSLTADQYLRPQRPLGASIRRPFSYLLPTNAPNDATSIASNNTSHSTDDLLREQNLAIRYRFFNRLDPGGGRLTMPDHIVPNDFFSVLPLDDFKDESGKQGSIVTIFSIWNTMMGSSLLAMPWAIQQAGLALGVFIILLVGTLSVYSAYRIIQSPSGLSLGIDSASADLPDVVRYFWGTLGERLTVLFSVFALIGSLLVYWVLMSNFLYHTGSVIYEALQPNSTTIPILVNRTFLCDVYCPSEPTPHEQFTSVMDYFGSFSSKLTKSDDFFTFDNLWRLDGTVPIYLAVVLLPLMCFKSATFFTKFNMLGTISVVYLMSFVASKAYDCGINVNFSDVNSEHFAQLFRWRFPALTGILTLAYFLHNIILTILRNQKYPENNVRDLTVGYSLAAFSFIFIGSLFYLLFPTHRSCISDNLLNNFGTGDVMSATARLFLFFQMTTVLPLFAYLVRVQFFYAVLGNIYPGFFYVLALNLVLITMSTCTAIFYPHIGSIIRFVGSFSGLIYIFTLPCAIHLKRLQLRGTLTRLDCVVHGTIVALGAANFLVQFFL